MVLLIDASELCIVARSASEGILGSLLAGMAVAAIAWALTAVFSRYGSGTRFAVWFSALAAITSLPAVHLLPVSVGHSASSVAGSGITLPESLALYLFLAWIFGACFGLMRVGLSLYRLRELRASCIPVSVAQLDPRLRHCFAAAQTHRSVTLCSSDLLRVPAALGYFRPVVVFPAWALRELPAPDLEGILLHELAHLRRWDDWTNLAQKIVKALFFFHPAVWLIESRLSVEREMACDDVVLAANVSPRAYAGSLLDLAEKSFLRRGVELAQAAVSHVRQLRVRIVEILRKDREGSGRVWKPAVALMAIAGFVSVYGSSRAPSLIAFSGDEPRTAASAAKVSEASLTADTWLRPVSLNYAEKVRRQDLLTSVNGETRPNMPRRVAMRSRVAVAHKRLIADSLTPRPMMRLSKLTTSDDFVAPPVVLVVMESQQFGADGPVFWRLTLFHLTQAQQRIVAGGMPKQI